MKGGILLLLELLSPNIEYYYIVLGLLCIKTLLLTIENMNTAIYWIFSFQIEMKCSKTLKIRSLL